MKNIHILPTDKPSRLWLTKLGNLTRCHNIKPIKEALGNNVNIYITSDEEIKEGVDQWYLDKFLNKPRNSSGSQYGEKQNVIILTTDKELIGVQEIPEYFLIRYIVGSNPIEYVEIKEHLESIDTMKINYELIIPKQETQGYICPQTKVQCDDECCTSAEKCNLLPSTDVFSEPKMNKIKKETFEEFINSQPYYGSCTTEYLEGIEEGAKWQQERSYSEEEVLHILDTLWDRLDIWYNRGMECDETEFNLKKWFNECELKRNNMTAVEWLVEQLNSKYNNNDFIITHINEIEQAKEMEKQQIIEAHGIKTKSINQDQSEIITGRQYYNEKFKK